MPDLVQMTKPGGFRQQPDLRVADAGRALLGRRVRRLGGRLHLRRRCSCGRLLRSRQGACAGDLEADNVANVDVDLDVDIAAYSGKALLKVMLMLRLMLIFFLMILMLMMMLTSMSPSSQVKTSYLSNLG